jgi:hypothetical protein
VTTVRKPVERNHRWSSPDGTMLWPP